MKTKITFIFLLAVASLNNSFAQTTVTIKPPQGLLDDAALESQFPNINEGTHPNNFAMTWTCSSLLCEMRSVMHFDLSIIPSNAIITSASLYLNADTNNTASGIFGQPTYGSNNAGYVRRVTQNWNESTVTWNSQPSYSTLNQAVIPQSTTLSDDYVINVTNMVQDMINSPSTSFGFLIMPQQNTIYYNGLVFVSNDNTDTARAPKLIITYTQSAQICTELILDAAGKDAAVESQFPTLNEGTHPNNFAMTWTCSSVLCHMNGLIEFDLSAIPSTAVIDSAYLKLYADVNNTSSGIHGQPTYGNDNAAYVRRITQTWTESTVTWNNQPSYTTMNESVIPQSTSLTENYVIDVKNMTQDIVNNPSSSFGYIIMEQNQINYYNGLVFGSGDNANPNIFPRLKVCYTVPTGISDVPIDNTFIVSPNPATNQISVSSSQSSGIKTLMIVNTLGEELFEENFFDLKHDVNISTFPPGVYFVSLRDKNNNSMTKKIVKM